MKYTISLRIAAFALLSFILIVLLYGSRFGIFAGAQPLFAAVASTSPVYDSLGNVDLDDTASLGIPSYMQTTLNLGGALLSKSQNVRVGQTNGNMVMRPILLSADISTTNTPSPYTVVNTGINSVFNYGPTAPALGTIQAFTSEITVNNSANKSNEFGNYVSFLVNNAQSNPGHMWVTDFNLQGPVNAQPEIMNGINMFMNNYYNGSPAWSPSGGMWVVTRQVSGGGLDATHSPYPTYPIDVGVGVVGTASGGSGRGFNTGIRVGGSGSGWDWAFGSSGNGQSKIGTAIELKDWEQNGLLISGRYPNATGPAIAIAPGAGNVGIGTLSPLTPLEVAGNTSNSSAKFGAFEIQSYDINNAWLGDNVYYNGSDFVRRGAGYAAMSYFYLGGYEVRVANASGAAGSTFVPTRSFRVNPDGSVALGGDLNAYANNQLSGASAIVDKNGRFGVLALAPATSNMLCTNATTNPGWRTLAACSSLRSLKKDIEPFANAAEEAMRLTPVSFTDRESGERRHGFIAEEVNAVDPMLSTYIDGSLNGVDYFGVTALLMSAFQELWNKVSGHDARITELEAEVAALKAEIGNLTK